MPSSLHPSRRPFILTISLLGLASAGHAADISLVAEDTINLTSFNTGLNWEDGLAPTAGNNYFVSGFTFRTPGSGTHVFAGDSLTLGASSVFAFKTAGLITVDDLILNGGEINNFDTGTDKTGKLAGTVTLTAASRINSSNAGRFFSISALIQGSAPLTILGSGGPVTLTNPANTFTGPVTLSGTTVLAVENVADAGVASALGAATADAANLVFNGGSLRIVGTGGSTNRLFTMNQSGTLDSSGTGAVNFTNTAPILHGGTATRTLTFNGTNTGDNIFAPQITDGPLATGVQKNGNGTWILTNANAYSGNTSINNGILRITNNNALGADGVAVVNVGGGSGATGILELSGGITLTKNFSLSARQGASFDIPHIRSLDGDNTINGNINGTTGGSEYNVESAEAGSMLTINGNLSLSAVTSGLRQLKLMGDGDGTLNGQFIPGSNTAVTSLSKQGAGTWTLNGTVTHNGGTFIEGGTLQLSASSPLSATNLIAISAGATLDASAAGIVELNLGSTLRGSGTILGSVNTAAGVLITPGTATTAGTLSINGDLTLVGGETLSVNLRNATTPGAGVNDLLSVTGGLSTNGSTTIEFHPIGSALAGSYRLINYGGAGALGGSFTFVNNTRYTLATDTATAGQVNLIVSGSAANLIWSGTNGTDWTTNGAANWNAGTETFFEADSVTFNDDSAATAVTVIGEVRPGSFTVNAAQDYTFSGGAIAGATGLVKSGTGTLTLNNANTFDGVVNVNAGTLKVGNAGALGSTAGGTVVASGATLDVNGLTVPQGEVVTISGSGVGGFGAVVNTGAVTGGLKNLVLAGHASIGGQMRWDIRDVPGGLDGAGHTLTKVGFNEIFFSNLGETHLGNVVITDGTLGFEGNTNFGDGAGTVQVGTFGTLSLFNYTAANTKTVDFQGGRLGTLTGAGNANVITSDVNLSTGAVVDLAASTTVSLSGEISGGGFLVKDGGGVLQLNGTEANTHNGVTTLNAGTLRLAKPEGVNAIAGDFVFNGGALAFTNPDQFANTATITTNAAVNLTINNETFANAVLNTSSGAQIIVGNGVNVTGLVTVNSGVYSAGSSSESSANGIQLNAGILRIAANNGPTTLNIGPGGLSTATATVEVAQGGGNHDAILNLSGNVTTTGDLLINDGNYTGANLRQINLIGARGFNIGAGTTTTVNADFAGTGSLTKTGDGTLLLGTRSDSNFTGPLSVTAGTLIVNGSISGTTVAVGADAVLGGSGIINGDLTIDGALRPGTSPGVLMLGNTDLTLGTGAFSSFELGSTFEFDRVIGIDHLTLDGTFEVTLFGGFQPLAGDTFQLFEFATIDAAGFNPATDLLLPALEGNLQWNDDDFATLGVLTVVPEPGSAAMLLLGLGALAVRRRRTV